MDALKNRIKLLIDEFHAVPEYIVHHNVGRFQHDEVTRAISELVMSNEIRRYEYILSGEQTRRCFYMPANSRLML